MWSSGQKETSVEKADDEKVEREGVTQLAGFSQRRKAAGRGEEKSRNVGMNVTVVRRQAAEDYFHHLIIWLTVVKLILCLLLI